MIRPTIGPNSLMLNVSDSFVTRAAAVARSRNHIRRKGGLRKQVGRTERSEVPALREPVPAFEQAHENEMGKFSLSFVSPCRSGAALDPAYG